MIVPVGDIPRGLRLRLHGHHLDGYRADSEHELTQPSEYLCASRAGPRRRLILCLPTRATLPASVAPATSRSPTDNSGIRGTTAGELLSPADSYQCRPRKSLDAANGGCRSFDDGCDWQLPHLRQYKSAAFANSIPTLGRVFPSALPRFSLPSPSPVVRQSTI
ncbi:hypothetical protein B0H17DRAFT_1190623 [Mycena rosella]|uniref:Uncharacterized protein n=1 Tax=Mycena rosella TaxID=1033263 RepID=A0AAD7MCN7_MYCRO|nr:hypothetical protein B0H17DRAFT_1190623 [Mycena rosella]